MVLYGWCYTETTRITTGYVDGTAPMHKRCSSDDCLLQCLGRTHLYYCMFSHIFQNALTKMIDRFKIHSCISSTIRYYAWKTSGTFDCAMYQLGSFYRQDVGERSRVDSLSVGQQIDGWGVNWAKQMWIFVWCWLGSLGLQSLCWPLPTSSMVSPNSRPTGGVWTFLNGSETAPIWMWHPFTSQETFKKVKARIDGGIARGAGGWDTGF